VASANASKVMKISRTGQGSEIGFEISRHQIPLEPVSSET
jgi:hypothetical protein